MSAVRPDVFYTYVYGTDPTGGRPLIFTERAHRTMARNTTKEGDLVIGVVSRNPADPKVIIPEHLKGRAIVAWQISHTMGDTAAYGISAANPWDVDETGSYRWPYALHAFRVWFIENAPLFRDLVGYTNKTHNQRAITTVQKVESDLADSIYELVRSQGRPLEVMLPNNITLSARMKQLAQMNRPGFTGE